MYQHSDGPQDNPRTTLELRDLHDLIGDILGDQVHLPLAEEKKIILALIGSVICWMLRHPVSGAGTVEALLDEVRQMMVECGYREGHSPDIGSRNPHMN